MPKAKPTKQKRIKADKIFDNLLIEETLADIHTDDCECVECSTKKWDEEEFTLQRVSPNGSGKDKSEQVKIFQRSKKSDEELIKLSNRIVDKFAKTLDEKSFVQFSQKFLVYLTGFSVIALILSLLYKVIFTQDYISSGVNAVALVVVAYINERIS